MDYANILLNFTEINEQLQLNINIPCANNKRDVGTVRMLNRFLENERREKKKCNHD